MSITKNRQTPDTLQAICAVAFPGRKVEKITELTEGMFNAAYRIDFSDGASVLKIAAAEASGLLSNEVNLMAAEVTAMQLLHERRLPHVPAIQFADFTRTHCSGHYFFMECLPGRSLNSCRDAMTPGQISHVMRQVGAFQRQCADVRSSSFGLLGDTRRFPTLHGLVRYLLSNVLQDAAARSIDLYVAADAILPMLDADQAIFDEVSTPSLVHWDMWEGNIFVNDGNLCGVIDWERAMWGEPLLDDRFRRYNRPPAFLEGYGQQTFSPAETRRLAWYDLFLCLTMITETYYRQYGNPVGHLNWLKTLAQDIAAELGLS